MDTDIEIAGQRILPVLELIKVDQPSEATMASINRLSKRELKPEDVYVRRTFVIHDAVDTEFTRFPSESIDAVARLLPGTPVLVTHARMSDQLPRAMTFAGERVKRDVVQPKDVVPGVGDNQWGAADFYWPRGRTDAQDLAVNIDTGIIRETSLRWGFRMPKCSICAKDMRECDHMPGETYGDRVAWIEMHDIKRVAEWSFVPRGGQLGTSLQLMRGTSASHTPAEIVDEFLKHEGLRVGELERTGMIELARCYDPKRKLAKKDQERGWFGNLSRRPSRLTWFSKQ